jgi:isopenicillin N synthase-like dioxygenase
VEAVPVINLADPGASLNELDAACVEHGFFLLTGHGLDPLIEQTWRMVRTFFDADRSLRLTVTRSEANPLGYFDRELTKRRRDHKEVFDFIDPRIEKLDAMNQWPTSVAGFRETMVEFFEAFSLLSIKTVELLRGALGLVGPEREFIASSPSSSTVRLNHYTVGDPVPPSERIGLAELGETALGHHTDPGVLTLLLQDDTGGLQTQALDGSWVDVPPTQGTVVVNLGDCMQAWTNDRYRAAVHRVLPVPAQRFSIPYFSNPSRDTIVSPLEQLSQGSPHYRPFAWREFSAARAYDNFADLGTEDTQVTDFRIG